MGKFWHCVYVDTQERVPASEVPDKATCEENRNGTGNYEWVNQKVNFDNVGIAFLALLQVGTFSGWTEIMENAVDSTEKDMQPSTEASPLYYLYFLAFTIVGVFFLLNLFIGVIVDHFSTLRKKVTRVNILIIFL